LTFWADARRPNIAKRTNAPKALRTTLRRVVIMALPSPWTNVPATVRDGSGGDEVPKMKDVLVSLDSKDGSIRGDL
jgi:hypothetical protein